MNTLYDNFIDRGHINNDCFHLKKQIEEAVDSGKLDHLVKDIRQGGQQNKNASKDKANVINMVRSYGYQKRRYERMEEWMDNEKAFPSDRDDKLGNSRPTIHNMIKFPTSNGIATITTSQETLRECRQIKEAQSSNHLGQMARQ
ncbi:hypothetical protein Tco_0833956 [Tanacetum coccineum]